MKTEPKKDSKRIMISLSLIKAAELEELAKEKGVSKSVLVAMAIEELKQKGETSGTK